jgi:hypothetical protein
MRFNLLARRIMALALGLALAVAVAACSSSSSSSAATSPSRSSASRRLGSRVGGPGQFVRAGRSSSSERGGADHRELGEILQREHDAAQKAALLQNGSKFTSAISAFAQLPLAGGIGAKVTKVVVNSATTATVTYNIVAADEPAVRPDRHVGVPGRHLEGRRRQPVRPVQADTGRYGAAACSSAG